jgi:hypothetical protein
MLRECEALGIPVPLLYRLGYEHNNCGGLRVRAGQRQWLKTFPDRYAYAEAKEQEFRRRFGKDVAILTETATSQPDLSLGVPL